MLIPTPKYFRMDEFNFSEDEIREQLELLGYHDVPHEKLEEFKKGKFSGCGYSYHRVIFQV